ncbi:MAG: hypothetical protein GXY47_16275 [Acidobacteria bacterium]|nr:hypothetical protein [Acidobacteriota bacterium]
MTVIGDASKARLIAVFIDHLIAFGLMLLVVALVPETYPVVKGVFFFLVYLGYFLILEALWSRTLGKYFQGLVVRKLDGSRCEWKAALIRTALRIVEVNPLLLGGIPAGMAVISTARRQRIGDLLARTVVVSDRLQWEADAVPDGATTFLSNSPVSPA